MPLLFAVLLQQPQPVPPAQPPATMVVEPIAMAIIAWDRDGDGRTSRAELAAGVRATFPAATGYLGFADWAERWLGDRNALPSPFEIDTDGDNRISPAELEVGCTRIFTRLDRNADGFVTRAEALTIRAQVGNPGERNRRGGPPPRR